MASLTSFLVFGPNENESLDLETTQRLFDELTISINKKSAVRLTREEVAAGFLRVANENMSKPIRALTEARGYRTSTHNLSCFGGAGGQHACAIARNLGIHSVLVHKYSSVLSAYGYCPGQNRHRHHRALQLVPLKRDTSQLDRAGGRAQGKSKGSTRQTRCQSERCRIHGLSQSAIRRYRYQLDDP